MPRNFCPTRSVWMRPWRASFLPEHRRGSQWSKSYHLHQLIWITHPAYMHGNHSPTSPLGPRCQPAPLCMPQEHFHQDLQWKNGRETIHLRCRFHSRCPPPLHQPRFLAARRHQQGNVVDGRRIAADPSLSVHVLLAPWRHDRLACLVLLVLA